MLNIGTELAKRYRIDSWLGRGPLGNIYLAEDLEQHRPVAVKELRPDLAADAAFMWGLRHEAEILNQTPEPGSLRPEGVVESDEGAYVLVDYEPGMGLRELEEHWPHTGYFARAWDKAPAVSIDEDAPAAGPAAGSEASSAGLAGAVAAGASGASNVPAAGPAAEVGKAPHGPTIGQESGGGKEPPPEATNTPEDAGGSAPAGTGAGRVVTQNYVSEASEAEPAQPPVRAGWPMLSKTTIGILLLTVLVIALAVAAWLRGSNLLGEDPAVRAAPGVLAAATGTPSPAATLTGTGAPEVAGAPSVSSSVTPGPTLTQAAAPAAKPSPTPTLGSPTALIQAPANLRDGPGPNYPVLMVLQPGDQAAITGKSQDGLWWQVRTADGPTGWLFTSLVTTRGRVDEVPIVPAPSTTMPATPTPTALATATPRSATPTSTAPATATPRSATPTPTTPATATTTASQSPTDTPAPAATLTAPAPSPAATADLGVCSNEPAGPFAALPAGQDRLGCPSSGLSSTDFAHQEFEHGQMLYRHDLRTIYVLYLDGTWSAFHDNYVEGEPFQLQQLDPPNGLKQPIKGFDRVWEQPFVRDRLGWATRDEASVIQGQAQAFERGQAMWIDRPGYLTAFFVLFADGTWAEYH